MAEMIKIELTEERKEEEKLILIDCLNTSRTKLLELGKLKLSELNIVQDVIDQIESVSDDCLLLDFITKQDYSYIKVGVMNSHRFMTNWYGTCPKLMRQIISLDKD